LILYGEVIFTVCKGHLSVIRSVGKCYQFLHSKAAGLCLLVKTTKVL
jgi:hypothetical protein